MPSNTNFPAIIYSKDTHFPTESVKLRGPPTHLIIIVNNQELIIQDSLNLFTKKPRGLIFQLLLIFFHHPSHQIQQFQEMGLLGGTWIWSKLDPFWQSPSLLQLYTRWLIILLRCVFFMFIWFCVCIMYVCYW